MCQNTTSYFAVYRGRTVEVEIQCGNIDQYGRRCLCDVCDSLPHKREEQRVLEQKHGADNAWLRSAGWGEL